MDCRERGSHARDVYPTQDTSRMRTASVKLEEEAYISVIVIWKNREYEREKSLTRHN